MELLIRPATIQDADDLTAIAMKAKAHWGYERSLLLLWQDDMKVTRDHIEAQHYFVAESDGKIIGFVGVHTTEPSCSTHEREAELTDLWILPDHMGNGFGRRLVHHAMSHCISIGVKEIQIASDPNAKPFYERLGAQQFGWRNSTPAGRKLPLMLLRLDWELRGQD